MDSQFAFDLSEAGGQPERLFLRPAKAPRTVCACRPAAATPWALARPVRAGAWRSATPACCRPGFCAERRSPRPWAASPMVGLDNPPSGLRERNRGCCSPGCRGSCAFSEWNSAPGQEVVSTTGNLRHQVVHLRWGRDHPGALTTPSRNRRRRAGVAYDVVEARSPASRTPMRTRESRRTQNDGAIPREHRQLADQQGDSNDPTECLVGEIGRASCRERV